MRRVAVTVHQQNRHRTIARGKSCLQRLAGFSFIQRYQHLTAGIDALADFNHVFVQQRRQFDFQVKQTRAILVGNPQRITKPPSRNQHRAVTLVFEQRIGSDRRAHLDSVNDLARKRCLRLNIQQVAHTGNRSIGILLRIF